jgi:nucleoside 2-deoxyribosyltransferase
MLNIYILTRLYNIHDRLRACSLERSIIDLLESEVNCYMPYRDSEEDKIPVEQWSETIFRYDLSALRSADLLLGYWDGPAFDEGIAFEIGCALAWGKKVVVLNTDFLRYHLRGEDVYDVPDPLLFTWPIQWLQQDFEMRRRDTFQKDMEHALRLLDQKVGSFLRSQGMDCASQSPWSEPEKRNGGIYIEPGPTRSGHRWAADLKKCGKESSDCRITVGKRFFTSYSEDIKEQSAADRKAMDGAAHMVFYATGPELPPGLAVSAGWAYGRDVPFDLVLDRSACMVGMTGALMPVNLMLLEAASWTGSPKEYGTGLKELWGSDC